MKSELLSSMTISTASTLDVILVLVLSFLCGLFILWVYKTCFKGVMYSQNFALTLVLMTGITAPVVMCIKNSAALSLGMVGALSIVRFRTAVKDPLDTAYMFWALTMGILIGAGQFFLAALTVFGIAIWVFVLGKITRKPSDTYLLVIRAASGTENAINDLLRRLHFSKLKSKTASSSGIEITFEIRIDSHQDALINRLLSIDGVEDATLVAYQNETL